MAFLRPRPSGVVTCPWTATPEDCEPLTHTPPSPGGSRSRYQTVAAAVDQWQQSSWSSHIINDITRHCATHYDEGQAAWASPWEDKSLYTAWREHRRRLRQAAAAVPAV